ncbi:MAG: hypothetical protein U1F45_19960 [Burkholderiales bacterium]
MKTASSLLLGAALTATTLIARADALPLAHPTHGAAARGAAPPAEAAPDGALVPWARAPGLDVYRITFSGGEPALVGLAGDGATRLELHVFDADGTAVCASEPADGAEVCRWTPARTAMFLVAVRNPGGEAIGYRLWTN